MGFQDYYERHSRTDIGILRSKSEKNTGDNKILRLFGFAYKEYLDHTYRETTQEVDIFGNVLSSKNKDTDYYNESYSRVRVQLDPALEDAFAELYFQKYETVWDSPPVAMSDEEFFIQNYDILHFKKDNYKKFRIGFFITLGLLLWLIRFSLFFILAILALLIAYLFIPDYLAKREWSSGDIPAEHKEKIRAAWLADLEEKYGPEMGAILKKMVILADYDFDSVPCKVD